MLILQTVIKMFNKMREIENTNTLFIICPFCQLENYLRTKFGEDVFFMTATANNKECIRILYLSHFIKHFDYGLKD